MLAHEFPWVLQIQALETQETTIEANNTAIDTSAPFPRIYKWKCTVHISENRVGKEQSNIGSFDDNTNTIPPSLLVDFQITVVLLPLLVKPISSWIEFTGRSKT